MDAQYMGSLKAFLSHNPDEMPINPGAPDPLRDRAPEKSLDSRRVKPPGASRSGPDGTELLPLIFAQLPLEKSYRVRR